MSASRRVVAWTPQIGACGGSSKSEQLKGVAYLLLFRRWLALGTSEAHFRIFFICAFASDGKTALDTEPAFR